MKKFLSLLLACIMIIGATVTVGAAANTGDPVGLDDLLGYYKGFFYGSSINNFPSHYYDDDDIVTKWYGSCPKCNGFAFFFVYDGSIRWSCLEKGCGKSGTLDANFEDEDTSSKIYCPTCRKSSGVYHIDHVLDSDTGKFRDTYFCTYCRAVFSQTTTDPVYPDGEPEDITCSRTNCTKDASFQYYAYSDGILYAYFKCSSGHYTKKAITGYEFDYDKYLYSIKVLTGVGGEYYVVGSEKAAYGEKKTIYFEADNGYVLTNVYVNGEEVEFNDNKITLTIKNNTVVRAYFTKISSLKNYTATVTTTNGGKVTATLNGKSVSADKINVKYADKVVYRFVPASENYSIESVKVNGKNVGKNTTYTLKNVSANTKIEVTFKWNCPYDDVTSSSKYYSAIEYATEAGILSGSNTSDTLKKEYNFNGTRTVSVKTFACALAEMSDVNNKLNNNTDRVNWAEKYELIGEAEDTSVVCTVQRACELVDKYLEVLEDKNDISFYDFDRKESPKTNCINIDMITSSVYKKNRNLTKNDLAAVLYLIANLDYAE